MRLEQKSRLIRARFQLKRSKFIVGVHKCLPPCCDSGCNYSCLSLSLSALFNSALVWSFFFSFLFHADYAYWIGNQEWIYISTFWNNFLKAAKLMDKQSNIYERPVLRKEGVSYLGIINPLLSIVSTARHYSYFRRPQHHFLGSV